MSPKIPLTPRNPTPESPEVALERELSRLAAYPPERLLALQTLSLIRMAVAVERIADGVDDYLAGEEEEDGDVPAGA